MNADKILPILCRYLKDTDNRLLASRVSFKILQTSGWLVLSEHPDQFQHTTVIADTNNRENHHP